MSKQPDYDDWALIAAAVISCIAILGLVIFLKGGIAGNSARQTEGAFIEISQPTYRGSETFYCDDKAFTLWTRSAVDAVLKIGYTCNLSDINKDVTCCWQPKE